jgi:hypothetical protein
MRENLQSAYVIIPALFGAFSFGGVIGVLTGINPYISAIVVSGLWTLGAVVMVGLEERARGNND